jgi:hypothetical protein
MPTLAQLVATKGVPKLQRPLLRFLLAGLLFEMCVLVGILFSPLFQLWMPRPLVAATDAVSQIQRWRQSVYTRERDPRVGDKAPRLSLQSESGQRFSMADLEGKKVALIFIKDGSG